MKIETTLKTTIIMLVGAAVFWFPARKNQTEKHDWKWAFHQGISSVASNQTDIVLTQFDLVK
jgi:hypothetical protein